MTTITNTMTAEEAYKIALNDPIARITNKSSLEEVIKTHSGYALWYARDVIKGRWIEGEDIIKTHPENAYNYAHDVIGGRWIEGEDIIKTSPEWVFQYARSVIKGRWIEGEDIIAINPDCAFNYCCLTRGRCEAIERNIIRERLKLTLYDAYECKFYCYSKDRYSSRYAVTVATRPRLLDVNKNIQEAITCYYHAIDVIKGRWVEAEDIIKQYDTVWKMYNEFLESLPLTDDEWAEKVKRECNRISGSV